MRELVGIQVISDGAKGVVEFSIIQSQKDDAISTMLGLLEDGYELELFDNRHNRYGALLFKFECGSYQWCGGGHGFSLDWRKTDEDHVRRLMKEVAVFNTGEKDDMKALMKMK